MDTIRTVRNVAIAAAAIGAGANVAQFLRNRQLRRALGPKSAPSWTNMIQFPKAQ